MRRLIIAVIVVAECFTTQVTAQDPQPARPKPTRSELPTTQPAVRDANGREVELGIVRLFNRLAEGVRQGEETRITPLIDVRRLFDEIVNNGVKDKLSPRERSRFVAGLGLGLSRRLADRSFLIEWVRYEFVSVRLNDAGDEAVVLLKTWDEDGWVLKFHFWLFKRGVTWRIYDFQEVSVPMRISVAMASIFGEAGTGKFELPEWASAGRDLAQAFQAIAAEDVEQAALFLARTAKIQLPPKFEAMRELALGSVQLLQEEPEKALAHFDRATGPAEDPADGFEMPILHFIRAACYNALERYEEAEREVRRSLAKLGGDPQTYEQLGIALTALEREDEARDAYRKALDDSPAYVDCLVGLALLLPKSQMSEFRERFEKVPRAAEQFEAVAMQLLDPESADALETLVAAFRKMRPDDPNGDYYDAQTKIMRERYDEAATILKSAIPRVEDDEERGYYVAEYVNALLWGGKPLAAYAAAADPLEALHLVGDHLTDLEDAENLRKLIGAHRQAHPEDVWLHYYDGQAAGFAGDHDPAERAYDRGYKAVTSDDDRELFRSWRTASLYQAGKWKTAMTELGNVEATFGQLADLMSDAEAADELRSLVALERKAKPDAPRLPLWEAEIAWIREDHAAVVERLNGLGETMASDDDEYWRYEDRLLRSLVRLKRFERALKVAKASTERDDDQWYEIVVHAAAGDADKMLESIDECIEHECYRASDLYDDDDIAAALKSDALKSVRKRYPRDYKSADGEPD